MYCREVLAEHAVGPFSTKSALSTSLCKLSWDHPSKQSYCWPYIWAFERNSDTQKEDIRVYCPKFKDDHIHLPYVTCDKFSHMELSLCPHLPKHSLVKHCGVRIQRKHTGHVEDVDSLSPALQVVVVKGHSIPSTAP